MIVIIKCDCSYMVFGMAQDEEYRRFQIRLPEFGKYFSLHYVNSFEYAGCLPSQGSQGILFYLKKSGKSQGI